MGIFDFFRSDSPKPEQENIVGNTYQVLFGEHEGKVAKVESLDVNGDYVVRVVDTGELITVSKLQYELALSAGAIVEVKP